MKMDIRRRRLALLALAALAAGVAAATAPASAMTGRTAVCVEGRGHHHGVLDRLSRAWTYDRAGHRKVGGGPLRALGPAGCHGSRHVRDADARRAIR